MDARRRFLMALPLLAAVGRASADQSDARIKWTDIELIDGRVLGARQLQASTVVAQFWASWCPFCGAQNPHVQKLYDENRSRGLQVVAFSIDKDVQAARDYMARRGYTFPVAMATAQVEGWFGGRRTVPETYVVNRAGRIVFAQRGEMFGEDIAALARFAAE